MFRVQRAPPRSEWLPTTQLRLSLIENEFWLMLAVHVAARLRDVHGPAGRCPPEKLMAGKPTREPSTLGAVSRPSWPFSSLGDVLALADADLS